MGFHDYRVAEELGLDFEECYPETSPNDPNTQLFADYVRITGEEQAAPDCSDCVQSTYGWPTYLLVHRTEAGTRVWGRYQGAAPKAKFRVIISELIKSIGNQ